MELLVVGANGLLGSNVAEAGAARGWSVAGTYHSTAPALSGAFHRLDVRETDRFERLLDEIAPDLVVNCAAMTDVDACEDSPEAARAVNGEAPGAMAAACSTAGIDVVHVSTDYVFDGTAETPYDEAATPRPRQVYGESKLAGERAVQAAHDCPLLVRLSFVYGLHRGTGALSGFPAWVRAQLVDGEDVALFTDQRVTPTRAGQAAETILTAAESGVDGLYHLACRTCLSPFEFGQRITPRVADAGGALRRRSMEDVTRTAARPAYTCLDIGRLETALGRPQPTVEADLDVIEDSLQ